MPRKMMPPHINFKDRNGSRKRLGTAGPPPDQGLGKNGADLMHTIQVVHPSLCLSCLTVGLLKKVNNRSIRATRRKRG